MAVLHREARAHSTSGEHACEREDRQQRIRTFLSWFLVAVGACWCFGTAWVAIDHGAPRRAWPAGRVVETADAAARLDKLKEEAEKQREGLGPSTVNMWSDPDPPTVTRESWEAVRNGLFRKGSAHAPKGSISCCIYRASLSLNLMQNGYKTYKSFVGQQGRLLVERAARVFIPLAVLAAAEQRQSVLIPPFFTIDAMLKLLEKEHYVSADVIGACHELRKYGNRGDHDMLEDL